MRVRVRVRVIVRVTMHVRATTVCHCNAVFMLHIMLGSASPLIATQVGSSRTWYDTLQHCTSECNAAGMNASVLETQ